MASPSKHHIAVIAGDGIGTEVVQATLPVLELTAGLHGIELEWTQLPWGCDYYQAQGQMMPDDALEVLQLHDAIFLGAIGRPDVPDHISVHGLILPIRRHFHQFVNLRPMRLLPGVKGPLAGRGPEHLDMVCVRENSEGEYVSVGGRFDVGSAQERAEQTGVFTRAGISRVVRYAFELAASRPRRRLASATKSNALQHSMVLWDEVAAEIAQEFPQVEYRAYHIDALAARMVTHPESLDVIVASNLFGDILTDLGAALTGSLGLAPGANLDPTHQWPSMFEPIHGSAFDIMCKGIADPLGSFWSGAMLLEHNGEPDAAARLMRAIERVTADGACLPRDLGGEATTREVTDAVLAALRADNA